MRWGFNKRLLAGILAMGCIACEEAHADMLPWLSKTLNDPFNSEEKAIRQIAPKLRPDACRVPDVTKKLTFNDVVISTLCNNPDTKNAYTSLLIQAQSYVSSYAGYLPNASASMSRSRSLTWTDTSLSKSVGTSYGISLGMTLYDFGQREFRLENAERALLIAGHSYNSTIQGSIAAALASYYALVNAQNALANARAAEGFSKESYEAASLRHKLGLVPLSDKLQAKTAYASAQLGVQASRNALILQQASTAQLMGFAPTTHIEVADLDNDTIAKDPFGGDLAMLMEKAKLKREDLLSSRESLKSAETNLKSLKRSDFASISASTSMGAGSSDKINIFNHNGSRSQSIGFSVSIPIFTGFSTTYNEKSAELSLQSQRAALVQSERNIEKDVLNAWNNYETAKGSWQITKEQVRVATELKEISLSRYKLGLTTILDVLNAQIQYNNALISQVQNRFSLLTSRVDLIRAAGELNLETIQPEAVVDNSPKLKETTPSEQEKVTQ